MPKMIGRMAPPKAAKPAAKPGFAMDAKSVLARAERMQRMEAGESRIAKAMPAKKPATPTMSPAAAAATKAALARAERIQKMEAGESALARKKPSVISTTVRMKETPVKKK